jgi:deoxyribose-phosphate aldolase
MNLAPMIDHTHLKPDGNSNIIVALCQEAIHYGFASVCVLPWFVPLAAKILASTTVQVCTVVGFPLGANTTDVKVFEATRAMQDGAKEIDMVINIAALKSGNVAYLADELAHMVTVCGQHGAMLKVIIETFLLTHQEKVRCCELVNNSGAHYIKTSTGFAGGGATTEDVALLRASCSASVLVKASGGIKSREVALQMVNAGAARLGTSCGVQIVNS